MESNNICKFNINRSSDLTCANFVYETKNGLQKHAKKDKYLLGIVTRGQGKLTVDAKDYNLDDGCVFIVEKGVDFSVFGEDIEYCYVTFDGRRAVELYDRSGTAINGCIFEGYGALIDFWLESIKKADDTNVDLMAEAVLLYSFAHLSPSKKKHSDLISKMLAVTDDNFTRADFCLSALAEVLGYDAKYLSFLFKRKKGIAFTAYLRDLRMKHALFLMEQGVVSVKNIAILAGFGDALYFSKIFKQQMGVPPKEYIENLNK
ncbi:MAG: AraC family transcriptional regulator [Ruminococcaceae bacterium]|nr:AraC family transcriptional regulator [Oscillospiraceae bacterium]